jgi:hypothetical protein
MNEMNKMHNYASYDSSDSNSTQITNDTYKKMLQRIATSWKLDIMKKGRIKVNKNHDNDIIIRDEKLSIRGHNS